jgi:hypothetical protein
MSEIKKNIIRLLEHNPGLTDRELTDAIRGSGSSPQYINQICRFLESQGTVLRKIREDGLIGNWPGNPENSHLLSDPPGAGEIEEIPEKKIKQVLGDYLATRGWHIDTARGNIHGADIEARRGTDRWIIEVKGSGAYNPLRVSDFLSVLGEILQRMDEPYCKYSVALPDMEQFRRLWDRLPPLARSRMGTTALFVNPDGNVAEIA